MELQIGDKVAEVRSNGETVCIYQITSVSKKTAYSRGTSTKFVREYVESGFIVEREPKRYKKLFVIADKNHYVEVSRQKLVAQLQQLLRKGTAEQLKTAIKIFEND